MTAYIAGFLIILSVFMSYQNCAKMNFVTDTKDLGSESLTAGQNPFCDPTQRPPDAEPLKCPNSTETKAFQWYDVICNTSGQWTRTSRGSVDYSLCQGVCDPAKRPSAQENMSCQPPNAIKMFAIQTYTVQCQGDGEWTRTASGAIDYTLCTKTCDPAKKPPTTSAVACPSPYQTYTSGVQNYTVTCDANFNWQRQATGSINYSNCPGVCDPATKPATSETVKCPLTTEIKAIQNYTVTCQANRTWLRAPSTLVTSNCTSPTCDPATKPATTATVACSAPYQTDIKAVLTYVVSCSGTTWVQSLASRDESQCPKSCMGPAPANGTDNVACASPDQAKLYAKQAYTYTCNTVTGQYIKTNTGVVDYSGCPKACTGTAPSAHVAVACPLPYNTGTAYQNYSVQCDTTTGTYKSTATTLDISGCSQTCDPMTKPASYSMIACPSPFQDRILAKQNYSVTCQGTSWVRAATTQDASGCPVNDCTGSVNPGTRQTVKACPGGATGNVYRTCDVQCSGITYSQVNCSADNYSECSCGANADYNAILQTCIPKTCSNGATNYPTCNTCAAGKYFNGISCVAQTCTPNQVDTTGCATANGSGSRTCSANGSGYGACTYSCKSGFTWNGTQCAPIGKMSTGTHCDIGGQWGWRDWDNICPAGTYPSNPNSAGGCPAGWQQWENRGCYVSRGYGQIGHTIAGCGGGNYDDECCITMCSASAPIPKWACGRDIVPGASDNWIEQGTCTCMDMSLDLLRHTQWIFEYGDYYFDEYGGLHQDAIGGHCAQP
jgi:hypothetical protein